mgnify:CR=1 FL=1
MNVISLKIGKVLRYLVVDGLVVFHPGQLFFNDGVAPHASHASVEQHEVRFEVASVFYPFYVYALIAEVDIEQAHRKASPADNWRL